MRIAQPVEIAGHGAPWADSDGSKRGLVTGNATGHNTGTTDYVPCAGSFVLGRQPRVGEPASQARFVGERSESANDGWRSRNSAISFSNALDEPLMRSEFGLSSVPPAK